MTSRVSPERRWKASDFENSFDKYWGAFKFLQRPAPGNHEFYDNHGQTGVRGLGYCDYYNAVASELGRIPSLLGSPGSDTSERTARERGATRHSSVAPAAFVVIHSDPSPAARRQRRPRSA